MSAVLDGSQVRHSSGYNVGVKKLGAIALGILGLTLCYYNAVHMHDYAVVVFVNDQTHILKEVGLRVSAAAMAFVSIFLAKAFVNEYRKTEGNVSKPLVFLSALILVLATMEVIAGIGSIQSKADVVTAKIQTHDGQVNTINTQLETLKSVRDRDLRRANKIKDPNDRAIAKDNVRIAYGDKKAALESKQTGMRNSRPIEAFENGSTGFIIATAAFSIICTFGSMFLSGYSTIYVTPLVAVPYLHLKNKINHAWNSDGSDFQALKHTVSPISGIATGERSGVMEKVRSWYYGYEDNEQETKAETKPSDHSPEVKKQASETEPKKTQKNRPEPINTGETAKNTAPVRTGEEGVAENGYRDFEMADYDKIKSKVISGEFTPTVRPIKYDYLLANNICVSDVVRQEKAEWCLETMHEEGVLVLNTAPGKGGKFPAKYILAAAKKEKVGNKPEVELKPVGKWLSHESVYIEEFKGVPVYWLELPGDMATVSKTSCAVLTPDKKFMLCEFKDYESKNDLVWMFRDKTLMGSKEFWKACLDYLRMSGEKKKARELLMEYKGIEIDVPDEVSKVEAETSDDEIGPLEFETRCGHCGQYDVNHVLDIEKRNGTVKCSNSDCGKGYVAKIDAAEYAEALKEAKA